MEGQTGLSSTLSYRSVGKVAFRLAARPSLWSTATRQVFRLAKPSWWRQRPFLPLPDERFLMFRLTTMYGGDGSPTIVPEDIIEWLHWCRAFDSRSCI